MLNPQMNNNEKDLLKTAKKNNNATKLNMNQYLDIKKNILELFLEKEDLLSKDKMKKRHSSQPKAKYIRLNLKKKLDTKKFDKKISNNEINLNNLNIDKEKNKLKKEENNKNVSDLNIKKENKSQKLSKNSKGFEIIPNNNILNNVINSANDINKLFPIDNFKNNSSQNINGFNTADNNSDINPYDPNKYDGNFSEKSSKNGSKNNLKINNKNNLKSNLSSSSFSKNFVLKSKLCKSEVYNENNYYYNKNNRNENNPIMNYFSQEINNVKNIPNYYLSTAKNSKNSIEEMDQINYNFFAVDEDSTKKLNNIISCNYNEKEQKAGEIFTEIFETKENDFSFADFQNRENDENIHKSELIKKKQMKFNNDYNEDTNRIDEIKNDIKKKNINKTNVDKNSFEQEFKAVDLVKSSLKNLDTNSNNSNINNNTYPENNNIVIENNNNNKEKTPLSFVNNIYYINNSNYRQYHINPIYNNSNQNSFYGNNANQNNNMNYYNNNNNLPEVNYYNFINNNQNQNDYLHSLMNENIIINKMNLNPSINNNNFIPNNNKSNAINPNESQNTNINININNENTKINNQIPSNKNLYEYSNEEILNSAINLIKEQIGCRFMQEKIKSDHNFANEQLFPKIKNNLKELSCDSFGNYFLQALIEILSFDNMNKLFDITQSDFTNICISPHGTRVAQKIIDKISSTPILINRFIYNLNNNDLGIIFKSPYGNHVIQKFLTTNLPEYSNFIYNYVYKNFMEIAESKHGVCIIQKCVTEGDEMHRDKIYKLILCNFNGLIKDQFGNYLIQYILNNTKTEEKFKEIFIIIKKIEENMIDLCKSKFSANVIEKCFEHKDNICKNYLIKSLTNLSPDNIIEIILDNYGIYVIQKALKFANNADKNKLNELILSKKEDLNNINLNDYKYKVIAKVINSNKELGSIFSKIKNKNFGENLYENKNYESEENSYNYYAHNNNYNYNNRGKNKRGKKFNRGNNNKY